MSNEFLPVSGGKALLDQVYNIKLSKHITLVVVLLSMIYTVYRTDTWLKATFSLGYIVAAAASLFIELVVLAAAAGVFNSLRDAYIAELKNQDTKRAKLGIGAFSIGLFLAFVALMFIAWSDAYLLTKEFMPSLIMTLTQITQMLFVVGFIWSADLDERAKLRTAFTAYLDKQTKKKETEEKKKLAEEEQRKADARKVELELQIQQAQIDKQLAQDEYEKLHKHLCNGCGVRFKSRQGLGKHKKSCATEMKRDRSEM